MLAQQNNCTFINVWSVKIVLQSVDDNEELIRVNLYFYIRYSIDRPSTMPIVGIDYDTELKT